MVNFSKITMPSLLRIERGITEHRKFLGTDVFFPNNDGSYKLVWLCRLSKMFIYNLKSVSCVNKRLGTPKGQSNMDNPEKLAT
jgi:hypothetical protein